jgi:cyanophycin synthetase
MRLETVRALPGPNVHLDRPVLHARIELEDLAEVDSHEIPGFNDRLLALIPTLGEHTCGLGYEGGFVERLREGTYFGHITEHVCIELQNLVGVKVHYGKTRIAGATGRYDLIIEYRNEPVAVFLLQAACNLVDALSHENPYTKADVDGVLDEARRLLARTDLGPSTRAIVEAAERRGIPWWRIDDGSLVQLGHGCRRRMVRAAVGDRTRSLGVEIACDKELTKRVLHGAAIPVPRGVVARSEREALSALEDLSPPLAVKPLDGNQGRGVALNLFTTEQILSAWRAAAAICPAVVVEEYLTGRDFRVLVVGGKVVAASEREPAHVVGDGRSTIEELVELENSNPLRGEYHEKPLTKIRITDEALRLLTRYGRTPETIPSAGEKVYLCRTANLSTGGTARDATDEIHPDVRRLCERAARIVGLDICGVDLITPDISEPLPEAGAGIVEINASPGIRMHHYPTSGRPRDVGAAIVEMLFPQGSQSRVPIVAITGTNGKTTVTRMIAHMVSRGVTVGMTTTDGIWIGGECVARGDLTGFHSARAVLSDPAVEIAVLETARGGIIRRSLGYDWSDVGVLTNIDSDHLGQDGIETVDDLLHVKSLVAERVREGGTLVLNADDPRLASLPQDERVARIKRRIVYFSLDPANETVQSHLRHNGTAFLLMAGWLVEACGRTMYRLVEAAAIPATLSGAAKFQIANALAATAACRALGRPRHEAADALRTFRNDADNTGRLNAYRVGKAFVLLDYGHNPAAFASMRELAVEWADRRVTAVVGVPGDRNDRVVMEAARMLVDAYDRIVVREDDDRRGREKGEVAGMLCTAINAIDPDQACRVVLDERQAIEETVADLEEGEIVVWFYESHDKAQEILQAIGTEPACDGDLAPTRLKTPTPTTASDASLAGAS